jgi:lambda family phage portal protein
MSHANGAAFLAALNHAHGRTAFGYDATQGRGKRREPTGVLRSEEQELQGGARRRLVSQSRDAVRNFAIAAWMIRRHLDYTSTFRFQARTGSPELDARLEGMVEAQSEADRCDVAGRHDFADLVRLAEGRRIVDGDVGLLKVRPRKLQAIEGDRIRSGPVGDALGWSGTMSANGWFDYGHGVATDRFGKATAYSINSRTWGGGFRYERTVPARHLYLHAHFDRFDQVRGVSPVAAGLNSLIDVYENFDYALAKAKVAQLFALAITRKDDNPLAGERELTAAEQEETPDGPRYQFDPGRGPAKLELDPGDSAEFLTVDTPGPGFVDFNTVCIGVALKSIDLPMSFYDEAYTNYSGARQAQLQYEQAAKVKRKSVRRLCNHVTDWWVRDWDRRGMLPKSARADLIRYQWVHAGLPWLDPLNEIQANIAAISAGLDTRTNILAQQGRDVADVARELAEETALFARYGLPTDVRPIHALIPRVAVGDDQAKGAAA